MDKPIITAYSSGLISFFLWYRPQKIYTLKELNCLIYLPMYIALEIRQYALIYCSHNVKEMWNKSTASNNLDLIDQIDFFFQVEEDKQYIDIPR